MAARVGTRRAGGGGGGKEGAERGGRTVNRGTIGENAIRNSTSLARQTPAPRANPALDHPSQFQPPYSLAAPSPKFPSRRERPSLVDEFRVCCQSLFRAIISQHFDMTYKPAGGLVTIGVRWGAGSEARMYTRGGGGGGSGGRGGGGDGREGEDSGRTAVPRSRWMLEGLFAVRGRQEGGREKEGCGLGRYGERRGM